MKHYAIAGTLLLAGLLLGPPAHADTITLSDGSKVLGTVRGLTESQLTLETKFAGTIVIDKSLIVTIDIDQPVNVEMSTGDRLVGPVAWKPELDRAVVETELGGVPIEVQAVDAIWTKDGKSPEVLALEAQIEEEKKKAEAAAGNWTFTFEAGLIYREGNTDVFNVRGRAEAIRQSAKDQLKFYLSGVYSEEDDERSEHEVKAGTYYEYLFTERWFAYWRLDLEYDEFEDLELRLSTAGGPGYYWIKEKKHELKSRVGIGYLHESYFDGTQEDKAQMEVGLDWRIDINEWLRFTTNNVWYPSFDGIDDYRLTSDNAFVIPIASSEVWKLKFGALYEYDSIPAQGRERLDQTYYANIMAEFK